MGLGQVSIADLTESFYFFFPSFLKSLIARANPKPKSRVISPAKYGIRSTIFGVVYKF